MSSQRWVQLDGIRGIAIVSVLLLHLSYEIVEGGYLGVDLFFALSGFLITSLLLSEINRTGRINARFFYMRRVLRLYPALLASVLIAYFCWWPPSGNPYMSNYLRMTIAVLTYSSNLWGGFPGHSTNHLGFSWSLSIEEQFYLVWPLLLSVCFIKLPRVPRIAMMLVLIFTATALRFYMLHHGYSEIAVYMNSFTRMDSILTGALGAMLLDISRKSTTRVPSQRSLNLILWPCFTIFLLLILRAQRVHWVLEWGFTLVAFLCTTMVVLSTFLSSNSALYKVLTTPPLLYLGRRSYGIYIYHLFIFNASEHFRVKHSMANFIIISLIRVVATLAVAEISFRYLETPFLKLKDRFEVAKPKLVHTA